MYKTLRKTSPESPIYNDLKINFATYKNILRRSINTAKRVYYHSYFKRYKDNLGKTWKLINKTIKNRQTDEVPNEFKIGDKLIDDPEITANGFNSYFCNVGKTMACQIKKKKKNTI